MKAFLNQFELCFLEGKFSFELRFDSLFNHVNPMKYVATDKIWLQNEALKSEGQSIKSKVGKFFIDLWHWFWHLWVDKKYCKMLFGKRWCIGFDVPENLR